MARTILENDGYTIINGTTTGSSAYKADTWVEYKVEEQSIENNQSRVIAYFYTARADGQTSSTHDNQNGGVCQYFTVNGTSGTIHWVNNPYNYTIPDTMCVASFDGWITHDEDGTKTITFAGSYTVTSTYISGGNVSDNVTLPTIDRGMFRVRLGGIWRTAITYVRVSGIWRQGQVWCKAAGIWKRGI